MSVKVPPFQERVAFLRELVAGLFESFDETVRAVVADGWPEPMVRAGFAMHRQSWEVDGIIEALDRELHGFGGVKALDRFTDARQDYIGARIIAPERIVHVWPALPGAGLSPVFYGWLLGAKQTVRPSSRGEYFAHHLHHLWHDVQHGARLSVEFGSPNATWRDADAIVISGADDTIQALRDFVGASTHRGRPTIIGYGHRVSFATIVDDGEVELAQLARALSMDIVLWHQLGCFSARAVMFCGARTRLLAFGEALGEAIAAREHELGARRLDEAQLARRAQARGVAQFLSNIWGDGLGWVQLSHSPWRGAEISAHAVSLHHVDSPEGLRQQLKVPSCQLQGAALWTRAAGPQRRAWCEVLARAGVTRICEVGMLQAPAPGWAHDGWPNVMDLVRVTMEDG